MRRTLILIAILLLLLALLAAMPDSGGASWPCGRATPGSGLSYCLRNDFRLSASTQAYDGVAFVMVCDHIGYYADRGLDAHTMVVWWLDGEPIGALPPIEYSPTRQRPCEGYALVAAPPAAGAVPDVLARHGVAWMSMLNR